MKLLFTTAFLMLNALLLQVNAQGDDNSVSVRELYFIEKPNYSFAYPANQEENLDKTLGVEFIVLSPLSFAAIRI